MRLSSESRIEFVKATKSDRKSGILRRVGSKNLDTSIRVSHPLQRTQRTVSYTHLVVLPPSLTWAAGVMISNMEDMKRWVKLYTTGSTNKPTTQRERLHCVPTTIPGADFGLGVGCTGGWFGYTGGINGYNTAAYYLPGKDATIIAFITSQVEKPAPGVANAILRDFTRILFPKNIAFPGPEPGPGQGK